MEKNDNESRGKKLKIAGLVALASLGLTFASPKYNSFAEESYYPTRNIQDIRECVNLNLPLEKVRILINEIKKRGKVSEEIKKDENGRDVRIKEIKAGDLDGIYACLETSEDSKLICYNRLLVAHRDPTTKVVVGVYLCPITGGVVDVFNAGNSTTNDFCNLVAKCGSYPLENISGDKQSK